MGGTNRAIRDDGNGTILEKNRRAFPPPFYGLSYGGVENIAHTTKAQGGDREVREGGG